MHKEYKPALMLSADLLLEDPVKFDSQAYLKALQKYCGKCASSSKEEDTSMMAFHFDYKNNDNNDLVNPCSILSKSPVPIERTSFENSLQQSFSFPGAYEALSRCNYTLSLTEFLAQFLDPGKRLTLHGNTLHAALEVIPGILAICWKQSECIIDPAIFLNADLYGPTLFYGPINVRIFHIQNQDRQNEVIMDTLGMGTFALPDIQCHFQNLEPNSVAGFLYNTANYLLDFGCVIEDGNTIEGINPGQRWKCRYETSLTIPYRAVIDINTNTF